MDGGTPGVGVVVGVEGLEVIGQTVVVTAMTEVTTVVPSAVQLVDSVPHLVRVW